MTHTGKIMSKYRVGSYLDEGLFVVLIMAAALASAALEAGALIGAAQTVRAGQMAGAGPPATAVRSAAASAPEIDQAVVSAVLARSTR